MSQQKALLDGLKQAIQFEGDGHHFYRMAAMTSGDPKGRDVFEMLAREELAHLHYLQTQYNSYLRSGKPDSAVSLPAHTPLTGDHPIFSENIKIRIGEAHFEMTALSIGMQLELSSIQFYTRSAEQHDDPVVERFYRELAEWEKEHYDALQRQQASLREDYWASGGFSPF